jgi:hypothetical protein
MQATVPKPNHISTVIRSVLGYVRPPRQQLSDAQITSAELTWDEVIVDTADLVASVADEWKGKKGSSVRLTTPYLRSATVKPNTCHRVDLRCDVSGICQRARDFFSPPFGNRPVSKLKLELELASWF